VSADALGESLVLGFTQDLADLRTHVVDGLLEAVMGLVSSWWALLALPAAVLIGFAFAGAGMALTTFMRSWQDFDLIQLVILPLFLFSGTFYPLTAYPEGIQTIIELTPLWHGVDLLRGLTTGVSDAPALIHVAYLSVMGAIGLAVVGRRLDRLLLK